MQQHPIPQDIVAYKFRLVGDMTLKQFLELAFGIVSAWLIFNSQMALILKWTLGPLMGLFGFALAFMPLEDRPLDQWIINFIKAIYKPTQFTYQPSAKKLNFFEKIDFQPATSQTPAISSEKLDEFLQTLPDSPATTFDKAEKQYLDHINNLFGALGGQVPSPPRTPAPTPVNPTISKDKNIKIRKLMHPQMCLLPHATLYQAPLKTKTAAMPATTKLPKSKVGPATTKLARSEVWPATTKLRKSEVWPAAPKPKPTPAKTPQSPTTPALQTQAKTKPKPTAAKTTSQPKAPTKPVINANFAKDLILPQMPDKPNLIAGITLNQQNKIIPSVILEIKNSQNQPVRALKSNKLGQFFIATALDDGVYQIIAEHQDHQFDIIKLEAKGEVIPPIKIQSKD